MARRCEGAWYRRGKNVWCATVDGKTVSLGVKGEGNLAAAQEAWHRLMANLPPSTQPMTLVISPAAVPAPVTAPATVAEVVDGFLADVAVRVKANTLATYTGLLTPFKEQFGPTPAPAVTPTAVIRFSQRPEWGSSHRHNLIGAISTAYKWAEANGLIPTNPLKSVKRPPKHSRGTKAVIDDATHQKLVATATPNCGCCSPCFTRPALARRNSPASPPPTSISVRAWPCSTTTRRPVRRAAPG